jgi:hypothetical protein
MFFYADSVSPCQNRVRLYMMYATYGLYRLYMMYATYGLYKLTSILFPMSMSEISSMTENKPTA